MEPIKTMTASMGSAKRVSANAAVDAPISKRGERQVGLPIGWVPRGYQSTLWEALKGGARRADLVAHRRWGKDEVALQWTAACASTKPGVYWHLLPEASQGRRAI